MTDTCRFTAGRYLNLLSRARSVTASSAQTEFPITKAFDKSSISPWIAAAGASGVTVRADLAFDDYGNFEGSFSGGIPEGWTSHHAGGATSAQETVLYTAGARALRMIHPGGVATAEISRDYAIAMGEELRVTVKMFTDAVGSGTYVRIYDVKNRLWWTGTAWSSTLASVLSQGFAGTYQAHETTVPTTRGQGDTNTLRVYLGLSDGGGGSDGYFDEVYVHPTWEVGALIGHNVDEGTAVALQSSSDGSSYTTVATATHRRPSLYALATARQTTRWVGILIPGTNSATLYAGEVVIAQLASPGSSWSNTLPVTWTPRQLRQQGPAGNTHVTPLSSDIPRKVRLDLEFPTDAIRIAFRDDLALRTNLGEHHAMLIPDTAVSDVYYGRVVAGLESAREALSPFEKASITLEEDGFPTVGLGV